MSRKIQIELEIDEDCSLQTACFQIAPNQWKIRVDKICTDYNIDMLSGAAHEFGHLLAFEFGLIGNTLNPRWYYESPKKPPVHLTDYSGAINDSEREAWDVAEMMFRIRNSRRIALKTYGVVEDSCNTSPSNKLQK